MRRSEIFDKVLKAIAIRMDLGTLLIIRVMNPDMEEGWKKFGSIVSSVVLLGSLIITVSDIKTTVVYKDYKELNSDLMKCTQKQAESNKIMTETINKHNETLLFFEQRYADEYGKLRAELNLNKEDDLKTREKVQRNELAINDHRKRIEVLEGIYKKGS